MSNSNRLIWFSPKRVGVGIRPCHPIGWMLTIFFIATIFAGLHLIFSSGLITAGLLTIIPYLIIYGIAIKYTYGKE
tara:strand:- start:643 stop:870 length:228 start_codon:yes stop_codon:yes gene_type:complete